MNRTEIAAGISAVQFDLAAGCRRMDAQKELIRIRKLIVSETEEVDQGILAGYWADAVEQLSRLRELLAEVDLQTISDMELFHLSACCEMARQKVSHYFYLRNGRAAARIQEETGNGNN